MRNASIALTIVLSVAFSLTSAFACDLAGFDRAPPPHVSDTTPATSNSEFEWGSDVDPWNGNGQARGWHYIKNLHDKKLSLVWQKTALVILFAEPLEKGDTVCQKDYGSLESYKLDNNAPINLSNDGMKGAQAYVQIAVKPPAEKADAAEEPATTGAELRRTYKTRTGQLVEAFARIMLRYYRGAKLLQLDVISGPGETRVGFGPEMLGVSQDEFPSKLKTGELNFKWPVALGAFVKEDEVSSIGVNSAQTIALVLADKERSLRFENVSAPPSGVAAMLLIAPDGSPLALTTVKLDLLGGAR